MKNNLILLIFVFLFISCSGPSITRIGYQPVTKMRLGDCSVIITKNDNTFDSSKKIGTIILYDNGFSMNCSEYDVLETIRYEGCQIGAKYANLYNIKEPSFWGSTCYQTYADFYKDSASTKRNDLAQVKTNKGDNKKSKSKIFIDTIKNSGDEIALDLNIGFLMSGLQMDIAKAALDPDPDGITGFGIGVRYSHWWDKAALDIGFLYVSSSAVKTNYESKSFYNQYLLYSGVALAPFQIISSNSLTRIFVRGGISYDIMSFSSEISNVPSDMANGIGYYFGAGADFLYRGGYTYGFNLGYENINTKFSTASKSIDGNYFTIKMNIGYKF